MLSAARFSGAPLSDASSATSFREATSLTPRGPVTLPTSTSAAAPSEAALDAAALRHSELGTKLQFIALFGNPAEMTIPVIDFTEGIDRETLWLARAIYSETKVVHEQELVAWVIRNRVETAYRGAQSYREAVLDPFQFSAFNPGSAKRSSYGSLTPADSLPGWQRALRIAHYVRHADNAYRPFSIKTRHFYSERSMIGRPHPHWVNNRQRVTPNWTYRVDQRRFRFYEAVS